uniref:Uncharacterized protein n=1 Tax=Globodera rostochiensis TaxID=31243 RepID=A0A914IFD7_GLORO
MEWKIELSKNFSKENENKLKLHFYLVLNELLDSLKVAKGHKRRRRRANIFQNIGATFGRFGEEECCKKTVCVMNLLFALFEAALLIRGFMLLSIFPSSLRFWLLLVFNFTLFMLFISAFVWHKCHALLFTLNRIGPDTASAAAVHPEP